MQFVDFTVDKPRMIIMAKMANSKSSDPGRTKGCNSALSTAACKTYNHNVINYSNVQSRSKSHVFLSDFFISPILDLTSLLNTVQH